jgi:predicted enzyme related to lactoylglutathione lyase
MHSVELILYVADQARATEFYRSMLNTEPILDAPGMTEFDLGGCTLGLMPADDIKALLPLLATGSGQRAELYLRRPDAEAALARLVPAGGQLLSDFEPRTWGETVAYGLDPDGHVIALAAPR